MKDCMITFRSVTTAQRAEGVLERAGLSSRIHRTPKWMEAQGCGYSLRLPGVYASRAVELLRREQVPFRKVYLYQEGQRPEEQRL